jgi:small conductance mechanosensitive channel
VSHTTTTRFIADGWNRFQQNPIGHWLITDGLAILGLIAFAIIATRLIGLAARKISERLARGDTTAGIVRSETVKHRQAVASVISSVSIAVLYVVVAMQIAGVLGLSIGSLVAPAAVLGAALGFGAQRLVQDLLSGFFVITEKHYGFGDLVQLTLTGSANDARGTVEDVTLRVTKLRGGDGEVLTVPNGQIVKTVNLSKDWARAVVDIPVPAGSDLNRVNTVLHEVSHDAMHDDSLPDLLLDEPSIMGIESIEIDTVNLRMVARTLPGKQFEVGRRLRTLVVAALRKADIVCAPGSATVDVIESESSTEQMVAR